MPRKTPAKKVPISIQRVTEQRLIDSKLRQSSNQANRMSRIVAVATFLGLIAGAAVLVYFAFWHKPVMESNLGEQPRITIPQEATTTEPEIPESVPAPLPPQPEVLTQQVEILGTPTGFLNIRSGPGTGNPKIGEASPGDVFDLISQDVVRGWYEIRLTATTTGWVTKQYSKIIE